MATWLSCVISPGQFGGEYAVRGKTANGAEFSLFVPESEIESETGKEEGPGWVRVTILAQKEDLVLVRLPRATLENGETVTVKVGHVESRPERQRA